MGKRKKPRPKPASAPASLRRGTEAYRRWEMGQVLALFAIGLQPMQIRERLDMTPSEYRSRVEQIREDARPGDALMVWARYVASCQRRIVATESVLKLAREGQKEPVYNSEGQPTGVLRTVLAPNLNAAVGAIRLLAQIDRDQIDLGVKLGLFTPWSGGESPDTRPGGGAEVLSSHARYLSEMLEAAGSDGSLESLSESDMEAVAHRLTSEVISFRERPSPPSLVGGDS